MFDALLDGFKKRRLPYQLVDRSRTAGSAGMFSMRRAIQNAALLVGYYAALRMAGRVYFTVGSSRVGFLRDFLAIVPARLTGRRIIVHLHGGGYKAFYTSQPGWLRVLIARTLSAVDRIIVPGELLRDQFWFVKDAAKRVVVIPNGVPHLPRQLQRRSYGRRNRSDPVSLEYATIEGIHGSSHRLQDPAGPLRKAIPMRLLWGLPRDTL